MPFLSECSSFHVEFIESHEDPSWAAAQPSPTVSSPPLPFDDDFDPAPAISVSARPPIVPPSPATPQDPAPPNLRPAEPLAPIPTSISPGAVPPATPRVRTPSSIPSHPLAQTFPLLPSHRHQLRPLQPVRLQVGIKPSDETVAAYLRPHCNFRHWFQRKESSEI